MKSVFVLLAFAALGIAADSLWDDAFDLTEARINRKKFLDRKKKKLEAEKAQDRDRRGILDYSEHHPTCNSVTTCPFTRTHSSHGQ